MNLAELTFTLDRAEALSPYKRDVFAATIAAPCGSSPGTVRGIALDLSVSDQQAQKALAVLEEEGWVRRGGPAPWGGRGSAPGTWVAALEDGRAFRPAAGLTQDDVGALPDGAFWWESNALWGWCWHPFQLRVVAAVYYPSRRKDLWDVVRCADYNHPATALEGAPAKLSFGLRGEHRGETTLRQHLEAHPTLWGGLITEIRR